MSATERAEPAVRALLVGRGAPMWAERLMAEAGDGLGVDVARLPAEGIRRLEATAPDVLVIVARRSDAPTRSLIGAITSRPLGSIAPIVLVSPPPDDAEPDELADELGVAAWLPDVATPAEVLEAIARALDLDAADLSWRSLPDGAAESVGPYQVIVEELEPPGEPEASWPPPQAAPVERVDRRSLFPVRRRAPRPGEVDEEAIRKKLREARHDDYFAILEVRRGSETPTIRDAYLRASARFDPKRLEFEIAHRLWSEIAEIRDALEDAWAVLGDPELRRAYTEASAPRGQRQP